ncbi:MAG: hypothetical protein ABIT58_07155 [Ferruginibacter sp.]
MQQDNKHSENEFRRLENQQLPDLSNMDRHWHNMEHILTTGLAPKADKPNSLRRFNVRKFFLAASILAVLFAAWWFKFAQTNKHETNPIARSSNATKANGTTSSINNTPQEATTDDVKQSHNQLLQPTAQKDHTITDVATTGITAAGNDLAVNTTAADDFTKETLEEFYNKLQKPVQQFDVNVDEGAVIRGKEGTVLTIPPSAFVDDDGKVVTGTVKFMLEEFYKYSDMISANISTSSYGKQLQTGGMIKITAVANGSILLNVRKNKEINLVMPAKAYDPQMKLFTSDGDAGDNAGIAMYAGYPINKRNINWELTGRQNSFPEFDGKTNFPNYLNLPYNVIKTGKKRIAKFALSHKSSLRTDEMEKVLKEKFGDEYDVIKVKNEEGSGKASNFFYRGTLDKENVIGDSTRMTLEQALRSSRFIERKDSAFYAERIKVDSALFVRQIFATRFFGSSVKGISTDSLDKMYDQYLIAQKTYSFSVKHLGWINCDKFCNYNHKTSFVLNLPEDVKAEKFVSQVVFISTHSVMPGRAIGNQISFQNIPANMGVYLVGVGERNGKVVSFMQKLQVGKSEVNIVDLRETTPAAFRKKIAELDMN